MNQSTINKQTDGDQRLELILDGHWQSLSNWGWMESLICGVQMILGRVWRQNHRGGDPVNDLKGA